MEKYILTFKNFIQKLNEDFMDNQNQIADETARATGKIGALTGGSLGTLSARHNTKFLTDKEAAALIIKDEEDKEEENTTD
jgi:hypothetical protein